MHWFFDSTTAKDVPPQAVLQNAITTLSTSESIIIGTNLPAVEVLIYINAYFSEVTTLDSTQKRSLKINLDDKPVSNPIVPPYQKVVEVTITNLTASSDNTLSLVATSDSTLPPLINALEIFSISNKLTDGTDSNDGWYQSPICFELIFVLYAYHHIICSLIILFFFWLCFCNFSGIVSFAASPISYTKTMGWRPLSSLTIYMGLGQL